MEFAYGVLGLSVEELAGLTPFDFELKCKGFKSKMRHEESLFRRVGYLAIAAHLDPKRNITIDKIWSMDEEAKDQKPYFTKVEMKKLLNRYAEIKQRRLAAASNITN